MSIGDVENNARGDVESNRRRRILIVDDDADVLVAFADSVRVLGYAVETAVEGVTALEIAHRFLPHHAFIDIDLPGMDGFELARRMKRLSQLPHDLRIVTITGFSHEVYRRRSEDEGLAGHLVKPVSLEGVTHLLRR